jgi:hypothetical protein
MLYQLSYASPAQTGQIYHTGNPIATGSKKRRNGIASSRVIISACSPSATIESIQASSEFGHTVFADQVFALARQ